MNSVDIGERDLMVKMIVIASRSLSIESEVFKGKTPEQVEAELRSMAEDNLKEPK
jgi:hypothetical protein